MSKRTKIVHLICAARPNFMKVAPLYHVLKTEPGIDTKIVHTGQHYDVNMSDVFFRDLELPQPHIHLGVGSGSHAEQTGKVMMAYEKICLEQRPNLTVVVGDVNSTVACTLAAAKLGIKTAHLEAGLRSFDRTMPEELNRLVTDVLADILWTPSQDGDENLLREGISAKKILFVGNIMIDSLELIRPKLSPDQLCTQYGLKPGKFVIATFHRPSNVDNPDTLRLAFQMLEQITQVIDIVCPLHPRTRARLNDLGMWDQLSKTSGLHLLGSLPYREFISLLSVARAVVTDSGGIQEETTYLNIPCLTARENTERPITISMGTNQLVSLPEIHHKVMDVLKHPVSTERRIPPLWDGKTAERVKRSIIEVLADFD